jgi:hypothetical protein
LNNVAHILANKQGVDQYFICPGSGREGNGDDIGSSGRRLPRESFSNSCILREMVTKTG